MKALSIRQPWAWLIVNGHKDIENRTWATKFRGEVLVHAGLIMTRKEYAAVDDFLRNHPNKKIRSIRLPSFDKLPCGGIVGITKIVDCIPPSKASSDWHMAGCNGFKLEQSRPLPYKHFKGKLSFFDVNYFDKDLLVDMK